MSIGILSNPHILLPLCCLLNSVWITDLFSGTVTQSWMILGTSRLINQVYCMEYRGPVCKLIVPTAHFDEELAVTLLCNMVRC